MKKTLRYIWYELSKNIAANNKFVFGDVTDDTEFLEKIFGFAQYYKEFVELRSGYKLLWNETKTAPRSEEDVQLLFKGILDEHCRANNIDFTREVNQGMGPVDFRFSSGYQKRVLLEAKLAKNSKFWNGLKKQLPQYMKIDSCKLGIFLVVAFSLCNLFPPCLPLSLLPSWFSWSGENKSSAPLPFGLDAERRWGGAYEECVCAWALLVTSADVHRSGW